jgi:hypothetical protein
MARPFEHRRTKVVFDVCNMLFFIKVDLYFCYKELHFEVKAESSRRSTRNMKHQVIKRNPRYSTEIQMYTAAWVSDEFFRKTNIWAEPQSTF